MNNQPPMFEEGPLDSLPHEGPPVQEVEVPISPCEQGRLTCIGRYEKVGRDYEFVGHVECGEKVSEHYAQRGFYQDYPETAEEAFERAGPILDSDMDRFEG